MYGKSNLKNSAMLRIAVNMYIIPHQLFHWVRSNPQNMLMLCSCFNTLNFKDDVMRIEISDLLCWLVLIQ